MKLIFVFVSSHLADSVKRYCGRDPASRQLHSYALVDGECQKEEHKCELQQGLDRTPGKDKITIESDGFFMRFQSDHCITHGGFNMTWNASKFLNLTTKY